MPLGMYDASVTVFTRMLTNLSAMLDKAEAHAEAKKLDPASLLTARLYPDMYPLARQVQERPSMSIGPARCWPGRKCPRFKIPRPASRN